MPKTLQNLKTILAGAFVAAIPLAMSAAPLTPEQALQRLSGNGTSGKIAPAGKGLKLVHTARTESGEASFYVFNRPMDRGYMILSADDAAAPVLGYSDTDSFDFNNLPPQMEWWLSEYSRQIAYAASHNAPAFEAGTRDENRRIVAPLMKTKWNQDSPYDKMVPTNSRGQHYPTGCVATAMAQVMKFWNYPERGTGSGSVSLPQGAQGESSMSFNTTFDWANMLDVYTKNGYNDTQADAVAKLMKACGYSTKMGYSEGGSGTLSRFAAEALYTNFRYNNSIVYRERDYMSAPEWEALIYSEIEAGRPVMYGGASSSVGHEFVCDGYSGDGYFHFNWGWGGMSDGYFLLAALDPDAVGIGGGTGNDGYNNGQDIVIGIQPTKVATVAETLTQWGTLNATASGSRLTFSLAQTLENGTGWLNTGIRSFSGELGACLQPVSGTAGEATYVSINPRVNVAKPNVVSQNGGYGIQYALIGANNTRLTVPSDLADGVYKVTICCRATGGEWAPVMVNPNNRNYVFFTKSGSSITVSESAPLPLDITAATVGSLYYGNNVKMTVTLSNPAGSAVTTNIRPCLYNNKGERAMEADVREVSLGAGESASRDMVVVFRILPEVQVPSGGTTSYKLRFEDVETGSLYDYSLDVRMRVNTGASCTISDFVITGARSAEETVFGQTATVYTVTNKNSIPLTAKLLNKGSYYGLGISAVGYVASDAKTTDELQPLGSVMIGSGLTLGQGESADLAGNLSFAAGNSTDLYMLKLFAMTPNGMAPVRDAPVVYFRIDTSDVADLTSDTAALTYDRSAGIVTLSGAPASSLEAYDISGRMVARSADGTTLDLTPLRGVLTVVARTADTVKTLKLLR